MDMLLGFAAMMAVPGYWVLQFVLSKRYDGVWRLAAMMPLIVMLPLVGYTVFALFQGSNLWPMMLILVSPVAFVYLAMVSAVRAMV